MGKFVYSFEEGNKDQRPLLGGKGANLAEMTSLSLPVPEGFTITTDACREYYKKEKQLWDELVDQIKAGIKGIEEKRGKKFAAKNDPLLVSVRSGAAVSMPGMMDTVLNLGLNDESVEGLAKATGNPRFAYDSYRRFIQMFSDVAVGIPRSLFEDHLTHVKEKNGVELDKDLSEEVLRELIKDFKAIYRKELSADFPSDPMEQLLIAVEAVFKSWYNERARLYRNLNGIPHDLGTAVNVQSMVFGNKGDQSGTGVAFTRNPSTGEKKVFGEFLMNAQGEDVVAGIRKPQSIETLRDILPACYDSFMDIAEKLEKHYRDVQDIEFTIEDGNLYLLQTRSAKRTALSAVVTATDLYHEGLITKDEALLRVPAAQLDQLLHAVFEKESLENATKIAEGLPASPGAATGEIYFTAESAFWAREIGKKVILVRKETSPEDLKGMHSAEGILTSTGGMTSHAAVVARGMGKCCVAGCSDIRINEQEKVMYAGGMVFKEGDYISLDGSAGFVYSGKIKKTAAELTGKFQEFMDWADEVRTLGVYANADTEKDAKVAIDFNAGGIGLCRTEHMFFEADRIGAVREMILSHTIEERQRALDKLLPMQRGDFFKIFQVMEGRPVTIRLLDPPLHEFLPKEEEDIQELSKQMNISYAEIKSRIDGLVEFNPMLGHRGCRLAVTFPEIARMQARAIIEAAIDSKKACGAVFPEIMIPLIGNNAELKYIKNHIVEEIEMVFEERGERLKYLVGTMIEVPRAALTAGSIAEDAEFFSFGTNDLTQMTFGFSRDDSGKFLKDYYDKNIFESDPFQSIDQVGIGRLMKLAVQEGKEARPDLLVGICGEHGGDPKSIEFCYSLGLDYVSCSPYRVPIARLAAAQATIKNKK